MEYMKKLRQPKMADLRRADDVSRVTLDPIASLNADISASLRDRSDCPLDG